MCIRLDENPKRVRCKAIRLDKKGFSLDQMGFRLGFLASG